MMMIVIFSCAMFFSAHVLSQPDQLTSNKIKVGLIYNFINFTEWPESAYQSENSPYNICIASEEKYPKIFSALATRSIRGRKLQVSQLYPNASQEKIIECQLIFIRFESKNAQDYLIEKVGNLPILTIAEENNSEAMSAMINFVNDNKNIAFIINRSKASQSTIQFSSKMLRLALKVIENKNEAGELSLEPSETKRLTYATPSLNKIGQTSFNGVNL